MRTAFCGLQRFSACLDMINVVHYHIIEHRILRNGYLLALYAQTKQARPAYRNADTQTYSQRRTFSGPTFLCISALQSDGLSVHRNGRHTFQFNVSRFADSASLLNPCIQNDRCAPADKHMRTAIVLYIGIDDCGGLLQDLAIAINIRRQAYRNALPVR